MVRRTSVWSWALASIVPLVASTCSTADAPAGAGGGASSTPTSTAATCATGGAGGAVDGPPDVCGDGACTLGETCFDCADDCGACPVVCGDAVCDAGETCGNCAWDCGACAPVCGDGACLEPEDCARCAADCGACVDECDDGECTGGETCATCAADCGACAPGCGDGACAGDEACATCTADCGPCDPACGDGACNGGEACATCPADCGACASCGDGACTSIETCASCPADCGACIPPCGDGACSEGETCASCEDDCGACPAVCGDGTCADAERCACPADCGACVPECGDGVCSQGEACDCPADCAGGAATLAGDAIDLLSAACPKDPTSYTKHGMAPLADKHLAKLAIVRNDGGAAALAPIVAAVPTAKLSALVAEAGFLDHVATHLDALPIGKLACPPGGATWPAKLPVAGAARFDAETQGAVCSESAWYPQGVATWGGGADGLFGGKRLVVTSEHDYADKLARVAITNVTKKKHKYATLLLVEPYVDPTTGRSSIRPLPLHADGVAWIGDRLIVASGGASTGFHVFDLDHVLRADPTLPDVGVDLDGQKVAAAGHRFALPRIDHYAPATTCRGAWNSVTVDRSSGPLRLVTSAYNADEHGKVVVWAYDAQARSIGLTPKQAFFAGRKRVQGVARAWGWYWLSSSGPPGWSGALYRSKIGSSHEGMAPWANGPESLQLDMTASPPRLYCVTEEPGNRALFWVDPKDCK